MAHSIDSELRTYIDKYNEGIDEAMARMDAGESISQEDLEIESESW